MREVVGLACVECKRCNYSTMINKKGRKKGDKLEIKKYCKFCRKHILHKEIGL